jgi:NADH-quinone oxidoreductase subunit F
MAPELFDRKDGKVTGVRCRPMRLGEFDRSGRRRPEVDEQKTTVVPADQVILAIGQKLDAAALLGGDVALTESGWVKADPVTGKTSVDWLFAAGDAVAGPWSVVGAISAGEQAAVGMDQFLTGSRHAFWRQYQEVQTNYDPDADPAMYPRTKMPEMPVERRRNNFDEVEQSWNESTAVRQAKRCLRCDYGKCLEHAE